MTPSEGIGQRLSALVGDLGGDHCPRSAVAVHPRRRCLPQRRIGQPSRQRRLQRQLLCLAHPGVASVGGNHHFSCDRPAIVGNGLRPVGFRRQAQLTGPEQPDQPKVNREVSHG